MSNVKRSFIKGVLALFMVMGLAACGSSDSDNGAAAIQDIEGKWVGTVEFKGNTFTINLEIVQSGVSLTATTVSTNGEGGGGTHAFTGTIDGSTVNLLSVEAGVKREYKLSLTTITVMSGTFFINDGDASPTNFNKI